MVRLIGSVWKMGAHCVAQIHLRRGQELRSRHARLTLDRPACESRSWPNPVLPEWPLPSSLRWPSGPPRVLPPWFCWRGLSKTVSSQGRRHRLKPACRLERAGAQDRSLTGARLYREAPAYRQALQNRDIHDPAPPQKDASLGLLPAQASPIAAFLIRNDDRVTRSDQALLQSLQKDVARQVDADEHHLADAGFVRAPLRAQVAAH